MFVLLQNPFYANHIRHKTHTSVQNKLNGGSSSSSSNSSSSPSPTSSTSSSSSSDQRTHASQSSTVKPYSRVIFPPVSLPSSSTCSITTGNRCYHGMKHILHNHTRLAQGVMVR